MGGMSGLTCPDQLLGRAMPALEDSCIRLPTTLLLLLLSSVFVRVCASIDRPGRSPAVSCAATVQLTAPQPVSTPRQVPAKSVALVQVVQEATIHYGKPLRGSPTPLGATYVKEAVSQSCWWWSWWNRLGGGGLQASLCLDHPPSLLGLALIKRARMCRSSCLPAQSQHQTRKNNRGLMHHAQHPAGRRQSAAAQS